MFFHTKKYGKAVKLKAWQKLLNKTIDHNSRIERHRPNCLIIDSLSVNWKLMVLFCFFLLNLFKNMPICPISVTVFFTVYLSEVESRTQGSRPRPRTQKKSEAKAKDSLFEDRHSRGQGQECSRPRPRTKDTSASALRKKKKRSSQKFFRRSPQKNVFQKIFQPLHKILTIQKILLSSSRGQTNFRGLEASRPRPRT